MVEDAHEIMFEIRSGNGGYDVSLLLIPFPPPPSNTTVDGYLREDPSYSYSWVGRSEVGPQSVGREDACRNSGGTVSLEAFQRSNRLPQITDNLTVRV